MPCGFVVANTEQQLHTLHNKQGHNIGIHTSRRVISISTRLALSLFPYLDHHNLDYIIIDILVGYSTYRHQISTLRPYNILYLNPIRGYLQTNFN